MKIIYCHSCDEIFAETGMTIPGYCPICGAHDMFVELTKQTAEGLSDRLIEDLWGWLEDVPTLIDNDGYTVFDEDFMDWPIGTDVEDVWHWFDKAYSKGVHELTYI